MMEAFQISSVRKSVINRVPHMDEFLALAATISTIPAAEHTKAAQDNPFRKVWA
jgi:hypothetical protein